MMRIATVCTSAALFGVFGLVAPIIWWVSRLLVITPGFADSEGTFVADTVFLLWPTQPIGVIEHSIGTASATILVVGANVLLFAVIGVAVATFGPSRSGSLAVYVVVGVLVFLLAFWGAGFEFHYLPVKAYLASLAVLSLPFFALFRIIGEGEK